MRQYIVYFSLIVFSLHSNAQKVRGIAGIAAYLDSNFQKSAFIDAEGGLEFKINRFIKPEIGFGYFIGTLENDITRNSQGIAIDVLEKKLRQSILVLLQRYA